VQYQPGRLVTPEAVVLDLPYAGPGTRIAAKGLDLAIQLVALLVLNLLAGIGASGTGGSVVFIVVGLFVDVMVIFGYPAILEAAWRGRTVGKAAFGLRVLTKEGAPIRFRHAVIRSLLFLVDGFLIGPAIGVLCLLATRDTVRLGDLVAGTVVIRERSGAGAPAPVRFPTPYGRDTYVSTLDVSGLSADDYALVRGFLTRAPQLAPEVRYPLAVELATPILHKLRLADPHMHPEEFLQCVAAAVQRRYSGYQGYGGYTPAWDVPAAAPAWDAPAAPPPAAAPRVVAPRPAPAPADTGFAPPE
jgi:uncharacterized RDD family membrane protein YckC